MNQTRKKSKKKNSFQSKTDDERSIYTNTSTSSRALNEIINEKTGKRVTDSKWLEKYMAKQESKRQSLVRKASNPNFKHTLFQNLNKVREISDSSLKKDGKKEEKDEEFQALQKRRELRIKEGKKNRQEQSNENDIPIKQINLCASSWSKLPNEADVMNVLKSGGITSIINGWMDLKKEVTNIDEILRHASVDLNCSTNAICDEQVASESEENDKRKYLVRQKTNIVNFDLNDSLDLDLFR